MTPDEEEQVRRALASLRPAPDLPPEVVARLDARLAELGAEREADAGTTRQDRRWPRLLVAAAAAVVVGIGVGTVLDDTGLGGAGGAGGTMEASAPDPATAGGAEQPAPGEAAPEAGGGQHVESYALNARVKGRMVLTAQRVDLDSGTLGDDVTDFLALRMPRAAADDEIHSQRDGHAAAGRRLTRLFAPCALPTTRPGDQLVAVRLDGDPATLVLREPEDGTRVAEVYSCGQGGRLLARTRVDAR